MKETWYTMPMGPKLFLIVMAAFAGALGTAVQTGLIPEDYVGLVAGLASLVTSLIRPPVTK